MHSDIEQMAVLTALNHMMKQGHFNVCAIDRCAEILGIQPRNTRPYRVLSSLHCVDFAEMPLQLRASIPALIQECLNMEQPFQFTTLEGAKERTSVWRRMLPS